MRLGVLITIFLFAFTAFAHPNKSVFIQSYRPFLIDDTLYEAEFIWRNDLHLDHFERMEEKKSLNLERATRHLRPFVRNPVDADYQFRRMLRIPHTVGPFMIADEDHERARVFAQQTDILDDLWDAEDQKFKTFDNRRYLVRGRDDLVIKNVLEHEPLHYHSDILLLWRWDSALKTPSFTKRRNLVGILAVNRFGPNTLDRLLIEDRNRIRLERINPQPVNGVGNLPVHWSHTAHSLSKVQVMSGDIIQINSLLVEKSERRRGLALLYFLAYTHGLVTTGRMVPGGNFVEINRKVYEGPLLFLPTYVVAEGIGSHNPLFQQMGLQPLLVEGAPAGVFGEPGRLELNVMGNEFESFRSIFPGYVMGTTDYGSLEFSTRFSPLTYQRCDESSWLPGPLRTLHDPVGKKSFSECTRPLISAAAQTVEPGQVNGSMKIRVQFDPIYN